MASKSLSAQTIERGLDVLSTIVASPIGVTPAEVAKLLQISRPAAYRAIAALMLRGFVARTAFSGRYVLARRALDRLHGRAVDDARLEHMHRIITKLGKALVWPVVVSGPLKLRMVVWATTDAETSLTLERYGTGFDVPMLESAAGQVYLAHLQPREQSALLKKIATSKEPFADLARDYQRVTSLLKACRRQSYAMTTHEPLSRRARSAVVSRRTTSLAVPIMRGGVPIACLSVRFFETAMPRAKAAQRFVGVLTAAAAEIAAGWD